MGHEFYRAAYLQKERLFHPKLGEAIMETIPEEQLRRIVQLAVDAKESFVNIWRDLVLQKDESAK
ncbi:7256_t:CDS:2, partial [Ambispora gerdemannii]